MFNHELVRAALKQADTVHGAPPGQLQEALVELNTFYPPTTTEYITGARITTFSKEAGAAVESFFGGGRFGELLDDYLKERGINADWTIAINTWIRTEAG